MLYTTLSFSLITILLIGSGLNPILEKCEVQNKKNEPNEEQRRSSVGRIRPEDTRCC